MIMQLQLFIHKYLVSRFLCTNIGAIDTLCLGPAEVRPFKGMLLEYTLVVDFDPFDESPSAKSEIDESELIYSERVDRLYAMRGRPSEERFDVEIVHRDSPRC
jgi:hypothetical protein